MLLERKTMQGIISAVRRNSLAENAGIKAGEKLCAVNGVSVHDIIELSYLVADEQIVLTIEDSECRQRQIVIEKYKQLNNQVIFTTTLKDQEMGKYDNRDDINHIDYKDHAPSKMLSSDYCEHFKQLISEFSFDID